MEAKTRCSLVSFLLHIIIVSHRSHRPPTGNWGSQEQVFPHACRYHMMTSTTGSIIRVTSHLCGEFTGLPIYDYQYVAHYEAWWCDQYISVQLGLRNVQFAVIAKEICDFIGPDGMSSWDAIYFPPWNPDAPKNGWSFHSRSIEGSKGNDTPTLPYCCTEHFRAISILLHVLSSHTHRRFELEIEKSRGLWVQRSIGAQRYSRFQWNLT